MRLAILGADGVAGFWAGLPLVDEAGGDAALVVGRAVSRPAAAALRRLAASGAPVLGVGEGAWPLFEAGLLPGTLEAVPLDAVEAHVRVEGRPTPFTGALPAGRVLPLGQAGVPVRLVHEAPSRLGREGQVPFRHCDQAAGLTAAANPHQAPAHIAGVSNPEGNVVALFAAPAAPGPWLDQLLGSARLWLTR